MGLYHVIFYVCVSCVCVMNKVLFIYLLFVYYGILFYVNIKQKTQCQRDKTSEALYG